MIEDRCAFNKWRLLALKNLDGAEGGSRRSVGYSVRARTPLEEERTHMLAMLLRKLMADAL